MKYILTVILLSAGAFQCASRMVHADSKTRTLILKIDARCFEGDTFDHDLGADDLDCGNELELAAEQAKAK